MIPIVILPKGRGYSTVALYVTSGGGDEPIGKTGISHLLEHMLMATNKIMKETSKRGIKSNAGTSEAWGNYWFSTPSEHVIYCLEHLVGIAENKSFGNLSVEKNAVKQELTSLLGSHAQRVDHAIFTELFPNTGLARCSDTALHLKNLEAFTLRTLKNYYTENYPGKMFIAISLGSDVNSRAVNYINRLKKVSPPKWTISKVPRMIPTTNKIVHVQMKDTKNSECSLVFYTPPRIPADRDALDLIGLILGGGMESLLMKVLRRSMKMVYSVRCRQAVEPEGTILKVSWHCQSRNVDKCKEAVYRVLATFNPANMDGNRKVLIENISRNLNESTRSIVKSYGHQFASRGKAVSLQKRIARLEKLKSGDLRSLVKMFYNKDRSFLVHISNKKRGPTITI